MNLNMPGEANFTMVRFISHKLSCFVLYSMYSIVFYCILFYCILFWYINYSNAYDGEELFNTLLFKMKYVHIPRISSAPNWTGLLTGKVHFEIPS